MELISLAPPVAVAPSPMTMLPLAAAWAFLPITIAASAFEKTVACLPIAIDAILETCEPLPKARPSTAPAATVA